MTMLANFDSFLGSVWFAVMLGLVGYIAGNVLPIGKLFKKD